MSKKMTALALSLIFVLAAVGLASALGDGNYRKGKYLFRKNCRSCHIEGGSATELSPISKLQADWQKAFTEQDVKCKDEWAKRSETDLNDIYTYLYKHAKDSPTPLKCK